MPMDYSLLDDADLLGLVRTDRDKSAFHAIYMRYSRRIFWVAYRKVKDKAVAEELTQNLFMSLWERRHQVEIQNLRYWLFTAIKFSVITHYKSQIVHERYVAHVQGEMRHLPYTTDQLAAFSDLTEAVERGIALLPVKTRQVFQMSRFENLSVKEISRDLDISEKAVEYHITQSLKKMRVYLKDYLTVQIIFILDLVN